MTGHRLARLSLRIDAIYCLALGVAIAATAPWAATGAAVPVAVLIGVGGATSAWGAYVWWASTREPVRAGTRVVMIANILASAGLAATGVLSGTTVLALAASVLALDVAAFAVSQGIALRRIRSSTPLSTGR